MATIRHPLKLGNLGVWL